MKRTGHTIPVGALLRALVILLLTQAIAVGAAAQDIDCSNAQPTHTFQLTVGAAVNQTISLTSPSGNFFWDFSPAPAGCSGSSPSFLCNGVSITLPAGSPDNAVPAGQPVTLTGTPTATGSFGFALVATGELGSPTCPRAYEIVVSGSFDVVFVLDRSGSMNSTSKVAAPATTRWDALEQGVNAFTPLLESVAQPGSRFGLTLFSSSVLPHSSFPTGLVPIDAALPAAVDNELSAQTPGGLTAMGPGLKAGMAKMVDSTRPRVVVLFTDGEQNVAPQVDLDGCGFSDGTTINDPCPAGPGTVKIVTIGIGGPEAAYLTTLQNLATKNRGYSIITGNATDFTGTCAGGPAQAFACAVQPALADASPQTVTTASGSLAGVTSTDFDLNQKVDQLLIQITLSREFEVPQLVHELSGLRIRRDGSDVTDSFQPLIVGGFTNTLLLRGRFPLQRAGGEILPAEGSYTVQLGPSRAASIASLEYLMTVFADDHRLEMDWRTEPAAPRVAETLRPTLELRWLNRPVTDADVVVLILAPGDDLGHLLARHPLRVDPSSAPDAGSAGQQKYLELLDDPQFLAQLLPEEQQLVLSHQGDGIYSAAYDPGDVSGVYQVFYRVSADSGFGRVQREAMQSVYVRFAAVDLEASEVQVRSGGGLVHIDFQPVTTVGRLLGPANASAFSVAGDGAMVQRITDHQDGRYTIVLAADADTPIAVSVLDDEIYRGPAGSFGSGGAGVSSRDRCARWPRIFRWICRWLRG